MSSTEMSSLINASALASAAPSRSRTTFGGILVLLSVVVVTLGCEPPAPATNGGVADHDHADHDHADHAGHDHEEHDHAGHDHGDDGHEHPATFAEGVAALKDRIAAIKASLGGDTTSEADGHVHAVGNLLVDLEKKAETLEDGVKGAVESLLEAFDELDQKIHADADPVFDDIAERVESAVATLEAYVEQLEQAAAGAVTDESSESGEARDATNGESDGT